MPKPKIQDTLLTMFGVAALIVFVLACRPSFSPDGNKIVFPVRNNGTKVESVALYDLKKQSLETLFVSPPGEDWLAVQWLPDGKRVLVNGVSFIAILPLGSSNPTRFLPLEKKLDEGSLMIPPPVIGKYQFIYSEIPVEIKDAEGEITTDKEPVLFRVNLETMEVQNLPDDFEGHVWAKGNQLYYIARLEAAEDDVIELGRIDPERLSRNPIFQLKEEECGEPFGFAAANGNGTRFALTAKHGNIPHILLVRGNALEKSIPVLDEDIDIGNLEWSPDEQTLYVAYVKDLDEDSLGQYGILEVPVNGGSMRNIPLFTGKKEEDGDTLIFQIALSADGQRIAATSACLDGVKPEDHALYLVDLSSFKRDVTKIAIPLPAGSETTAGK